MYFDHSPILQCTDYNITKLSHGQVIKEDVTEIRKVCISTIFSGFVTFAIFQILKFVVRFHSK